MKGGPSEGVASHQRPVIKGSTLHLSEILRARGTVLHTHRHTASTPWRPWGLTFVTTVPYNIGFTSKGPSTWFWTLSVKPFWLLHCNNYSAYRDTLLLYHEAQRTAAAVQTQVNLSVKFQITPWKSLIVIPWTFLHEQTLAIALQCLHKMCACFF